MTTPKLPRKNLGVEWMLRDFFRRNPHEELSIDDAVAKFDRQPSVRNTLSKLVGEGVLERVSVYRLKREDTP